MPTGASTSYNPATQYGMGKAKPSTLNRYLLRKQERQECRDCLLMFDALLLVVTIASLMTTLARDLAVGPCARAIRLSLHESPQRP